ncbi:hypothetical protein BCV69DRAFT_167375 [Microstroma glucosiphilum]|uniref:Zn(2)-C6 fungal-type domain-containing protein n=1 Tax=Pseudomicrostroma glucosiphilum TaxID=1684307 RepID=A0A316U7W6_9BASI|nr:hypothetical protein BCV69DRAFT_167375 [Pseudomicrostroma glucosiphilum]PWN21339.1 hypothetical protein BCV69DRAFT_167375 [Pseudomicrostroma glucosiphilum]
MTNPHYSRMDTYRPQPQYHTFAEESAVASVSSPSAFSGGPYPPPRLPSPTPSAPRSYNPRERFFHPAQPPTPSSSSSGGQAPARPGYTHLPPPSPTAPFPPHGATSSSAPQSRRLVPPSGLIPPFGPRLPPLFSGPQYDSLGLRQSEPSYSSSPSIMRPELPYSPHDARGAGPSGTRGSEPRAYHIKDEDSATDGGSPPKRKRAKTGTKITRNRKITSCLPCRERKQKCDRTHPICQKCIDDGRQCVYAKNEDLDGAVSASPQDTKKPKVSSIGPSDTEQRDPPRAASSSGGHSTCSHQDSEFLTQRRENLARLFTAARDRTLDFEKRVEAARAAAVAEVLFAENEVQDLRRDHLVLPTRQQVQHLLDIYKQDVELFNFIVLIDLNRSRIGGFLDWWHSNPVTLPVESDAPLAPLVLTILALASQAKRTRDSANAPEGSQAGSTPVPTSNDKYLPYLSSERVLLETAGKCISSLTIVCPSSWNSTYASPLDVVRAEVLRTLWHIGECHLQYAAICIASALRLAYAAGLHRDPLHWKNVGMGPYEVQVRRSTWWNVAFLETFHSHRIGQPSLITPGTVDTELPTNYDIVAEQHARASLIPMTRKRFYSLVTQLHVAQLFLQHSGKVFLLNLQPNDIVKGLSEIYKLWVAGMPKELQKLSRETNSSDSAYRPGFNESDSGDRKDFGDETDEEAQAFRWSIFLIRIQKLQGLLNVHRPACEVGSGCVDNDAQAVSSLRICLEASARLVHLCHQAIMCRPAPPHLLLGIISYYSFNAGAVLASQFSTQTAYSSICRPAFQKALAVLDYLAKNQALGNVSEQAERYCAAVREIAAIPEMFQKKLTSSSSQRSSSQSERAEPEAPHGQSSKPAEDHAAPPRLASPVPSAPGDNSTSYSRNAAPQLNYAHGTFASSSQSRYDPGQQQGQAQGSEAATGLVYDHQGQPQNAVIAALPGPPDQFLSATRAKASSNITDRPLPGRNPLNYSYFGFPPKADPHDASALATEPYYEAVMAAVPMPNDLPKPDDSAWFDTSGNAMFAGGALLSASTASPLSAGGGLAHGMPSDSHQQQHQQQQQQPQSQSQGQGQQYNTFQQYPPNVGEDVDLRGMDPHDLPVGVDWPLLGDFVQRILQGENVSDMPSERRSGQGRNQYKLGGGASTMTD